MRVCNPELPSSLGFAGTGSCDAGEERSVRRTSDGRDREWGHPMRRALPYALHHNSLIETLVSER